MYSTEFADKLIECLTPILEDTVTSISKIGDTVNDTLVITTKSDQNLLKLMTRKPGNPTEQDRFLKCQYLAKLLRNRGIHVPEVIYADNTERLISTQKIYGMQLTEWIEGKTIEQLWDQCSLSVKGELLMKLAKMVATIHQVELNQSGMIDPVRPEFNTSTSWVDYITNTARVGISSLMENPIIDNALLAEVEYIYFTRLEILQPELDKTCRLIHSDLNQQNVIVAEGSNELYLVDWEWAKGGDPYYDLISIDEEFLSNNLEFRQLWEEEYGIDLQSLQERLLLYQIHGILASCGHGYLYHNPSEESFKSVEKQLRELVQQLQDI